MFCICRLNGGTELNWDVLQGPHLPRILFVTHFILIVGFKLFNLLLSEKCIIILLIANTVNALYYIKQNYTDLTI